MTSKPETVIAQIKELDNKQHSKLFLEFYDWLTDDHDSIPRNASTYLKILRMFSNDIGSKPLGEVTKEDIVEFLDKRKKNLDIDPEKKWQRTCN